MYRSNRGYPGPGGFMGHETLEESNQQQEGELKGKIGALKSLSINIGVEVREQNRLLNEMDDGFDSTASMFSNTIGKLSRLVKNRPRFYIYYLLFFCLFVFLVLWFYIR
jgi:blocked-early-in-transport protein 1